MLDHIHLDNLICIDIETVSCYATFNEVPEVFKELFLTKTDRLRLENVTDEEHYANSAAIYAEFGKIICITVGIFAKEKGSEHPQFRIKSFSGDDEKKILLDFAQLLNERYGGVAKYMFSGHNIKEFDIPYICRRMLINQVTLPQILDLSGKKPYEVTMIDTMQLWKFGDYKHYTSLKLIALLLGIDSPKEDIEGKDVGRVYWKENGLTRITEYCQRDVLTIGQLILRFKGLPLLTADNVVRVLF